MREKLAPSMISISILDRVHRTKSLKGSVTENITLKTSNNEKAYLDLIKSLFEYDKGEEIYDFGTSYTRRLKIDTIKSRFAKGEVVEEVLNALSLRLSAHARLGGAGYRDGVEQAADLLFHDLNLEIKISNIFRRAFGIDLILERTRAGGVFRVGDRTKLPKGNHIFTHKAKKQFEDLHEVTSQGDGMRSFARMLLEIMVTKRSVLIIDEPELFLHPPQIRQLAQLLIQDTPKDTQILVATHSESFVRAIVENNNARTHLVRLTRKGQTTTANTVNAQQLSDLWNDANISASGILESLFHEHAILCEGDSDLRFFRALRGALGSNSHELDAEFYHCGGKDRMPKIIKALKSLNISTIAILDIDILADKAAFGRMVESLGGDPLKFKSDYLKVANFVNSRKTVISGDYFASETLKILENARGKPFVPNEVSERTYKLLKKASPWAQIKELGISYFKGEAYDAARRIIKNAKRFGLIINPYGELESLCHSSGRSSKAAWLNETLKRDLSTDPDLESARSLFLEIKKAAQPA